MHPTVLSWILMVISGQPLEHVPLDLRRRDQGRSMRCTGRSGSNPAIAQWRFEQVRARYQAILKRACNDSTVEEAISPKGSRGFTRDEQAAEAARTIENPTRREPSPRPPGCR